MEHNCHDFVCDDNNNDAVVPVRREVGGKGAATGINRGESNTTRKTKQHA